MAGESIKLDNGWVAVLPKDMTLGDHEDLVYVEERWANGRGSVRFMMAQILLFVRRWENVPDTFVWPELPADFTVNGEAFKARVASLRSHFRSTAPFAPIYARTSSWLQQDMKLEGNSDTPSASATTSETAPSTSE